jgi:ribosomal protein L11 methyltransferase
VTSAYERYTLRLAPSGPAAGAEVGASLRAGDPLLEDDWSGAAAYARTPDPAALDYSHPEAIALVTDLQPAGWQEEDGGDTLIFWLEEGRAADVRVAGALAALAALGHLSSAPEPPGWDDAWQEFHQPHTVGRVFLRPPWSPPREGVLDVVVDAARAFGTGGHATTRQCVAALQEIAPGSLLDLGCGSGVVALAALRLGFGPVWGVDIDMVAVAEARQNAAMNGLTADFVAGDATDPALALPDADVVVANIALQPILRLASRFAPEADAAVPPGLRPRDLVLAGLLREQAGEAAAALPAYAVAGRLEEDMWLLLHLRRRS